MRTYCVFLFFRPNPRHCFPHEEPNWNQSLSLAQFVPLVTKSRLKGTPSSDLLNLSIPGGYECGSAKRLKDFRRGVNILGMLGGSREMELESGVNWPRMESIACDWFPFGLMDLQRSRNENGVSLLFTIWSTKRKERKRKGVSFHSQ